MTSAVVGIGDTHHVLVVDDAPEFVALIEPVLRREGFQVSVARDGPGAITAVDDLHPDVIVLDLTLPGIDGIEVCRRIRDFSDAYVVMLTARGDELDRVVGLEVGADDYMTKPFSPRELVARLRAMLRRPRTPDPQPDASVHRVLDLVLDSSSRRVTVGGEEVALTRIEFDLLEALATNPRQVLSRTTLRGIVWGPEWFGDDHAVDVHVANLRKKIDRPGGPRHIRTVRGVGYRMEQPD